MAKRTPLPKHDFTLDGFRYTSIEGYSEREGQRIYVTTTGTAEMIRQYLKQTYPNVKTWIKSRKFANGNSIDVYVNRVPENIFSEIESFVKGFNDGYFDGMTDTYMYTRKDEQAEDGRMISAGAKYISAENNPPYGSPERDQPAPNYSPMPTPQQPSKPNGGKPYPYKKPNGELVHTCPAGWELYRVVINTKGIDKAVYKLKKTKDTPSNREQWDVIRGEMLNVGFRWNKFGQTFDMFVEQIQQSTIDAVCAVLAKYYTSGGQNQPAPAPIPAPAPSPAPQVPNTPPAPDDNPDTEKPENGTVRLKSVTIKWAEGTGEYADKYPKRFPTFTEATLFIRNNLKPIPTVGYEKHGVEWHWSNGTGESDRWDIGKGDNDPTKWDNLFAFNFLRGVFFDACRNRDLSKDIQYIKNRGANGLEINLEFLNSMLDWFATTPYYQREFKMTELQIKQAVESRLKILWDICSQTQQPTAPQNIDSIIRGYELLLQMETDVHEKVRIASLIRGYKLLQN